MENLSSGYNGVVETAASGGVDVAPEGALQSDAAPPHEDPEKREVPETHESPRSPDDVDQSELDAAIAFALPATEGSDGDEDPSDAIEPQPEGVSPVAESESMPPEGIEVPFVEENDSVGDDMGPGGGTEAFSSSMSSVSSVDNVESVDEPAVSDREAAQPAMSDREAAEPETVVDGETPPSGVIVMVEVGAGDRGDAVADVAETPEEQLEAGSLVAPSPAVDPPIQKGGIESFQTKAQKLMEDNRRYQADFAALMERTPRDEEALDRVWKMVLATQEDYERLTESFFSDPAQPPRSTAESSTSLNAESSGEVAGSDGRAPCDPAQADVAIEVDELQHRVRMLQQQADAVSQEIAFLQKERPPDVVKIHELRMTLQKLEEDLVHSRGRLEELRPVETAAPVATQEQDVEPAAVEDPVPMMCGSLVKEGHVIKNWKTRWFELVDDRLVYYVSEQNRQMKGQIRLTAAVKVEELDKLPHGFTVYGGPNKSYKMTAETDELRSKWIATISRKIAELPQ